MNLNSSTYKRLFSDLPSIILILDSYGEEIENVQNLFPILEQHFKDHDLNNAKKSI